MALKQGSRLGRYEIVAPLGAGGMGEVYRARDTELGREVAVKVLPAAVADDESRLARFKREARAVAALSHPNILLIHDVGAENGVHYAVMELLEGDTLRARIPEGGLPWQRAAEWGATIAEGVAAAHGRGIVHRDLKPENIFITADGRVKVLDFGLAQVQEPVEPEQETATLTPAGTQAGTILGTVGYMSPEQVMGRASDPRSDIFALGCILHEMVSGRQAFAADTAVEIMAAILKEEPAQLSTTGTAVPVELERVIHRCLEKRPEARFQSAADLSYALRSIGSASAPVMVGPTAGIRPAARRWPAAAVVTVLAAAAIGGVIWQQARTDRSTAAAAGEPSAAITTSPGEDLVDEWLVVVEPFENHTGDPSLDTAGVVVADRLVQSLPRLTHGLKLMPPVSVVAADVGDTGFARRESSPGMSRGRILITGTYTPAEDGLEVVGQVRDLDIGRVLFASEPLQVPTLPSNDSLEPLADTMMATVATHIQWGLQHDSHVPTYDVFRKYLIGWEMSWSEGQGRYLVEEALEADPEYLRPAFQLAGSSIWRGARDEAEPLLEHIRQRAQRLTEHESVQLELLEAWANDQPGRALRAARRLQDIDPSNLANRFFRAEFAAQLNRPGEVVDSLAGILDRVPRTLSWYRAHVTYELRAAYERLGDYQGLYDFAKDVRREEPGSDLGMSAQAVALAGLGRLDELDALVDECRSQPGGDCFEWGLVIQASPHLALAGHQAKSVQYARRLVDEHTSPPDHDPEGAYWTEAYLAALRLAGMWDEYADFVRTSLQKFPAETPLHRYLLCCSGMAAAQAGDRATAEALIEDHLKENEFVYAGQVAGYLGDLDRAVELLRRGIESDPGWSYKNLHRWDPDLQPLLGFEPFEELIRPKG